MVTSAKSMPKMKTDSKSASKSDSKNMSRNDCQWGAWVWVKWKAGSPVNAWKEWEKAKWWNCAWSQTGTWDLAIWVDIDNMDDVEKLVWNDIRKNKWVEKTETRMAKKFC